MRESDIVHEAGNYWVCREPRAYTVYCANPLHYSVADSSYRKDADGLSLAIARCNYLAKRLAAKSLQR